MTARPIPSLDAMLFDLDGTLIDSVPLILDSFRHAFSACGFAVPDAHAAAARSRDAARAALRALCVRSRPSSRP